MRRENVKAIEFKVCLDEQGFRTIRTQFGFDESILWTHQDAIKFLDEQGIKAEFKYDYSMAKDEQIIMKTYTVDDDFATMFLLKFAEITKPVRNYETVSIYDK